MSSPIKPMTVERQLAQALFALSLVLLLSACFSWFWPGFAVAVQWSYLVHSGFGIILSLILIPYLVVHFQRTIGVRRSWLALSGWVCALAFVAIALSGLQILWQGQTEAKRWIFQGHIVAAVVVVVLLLAHVSFHAVFLPAKRKKNEPTRFPSLSGGVLTTALYYLATAVLVVAIATALYQLKANPYQDQPAVQPYLYSYGEHPFRPSQTETSTNGFLDARRLGESERCASCHTEIAQQWQASIHAQAASDKAYQTNIKLLSERKGMPATRYCEGCHAPAALLSGQLSTGGKLDTPGHLQEGVSCMACHGIDRVEHVKGVASYRFRPPEPYLFAGDNGKLATLIHNLLIRLKPEQHKADLARSVLATPEICATCHAQFMDKSFNTWGYVKMQDDYTAWLNGPYSGQTRQTFAQDAVKRCQDCHFPLAKGNDPSASVNGEIKTHFNIGANTAIPYAVGNQAQLQRTRQFLKADKIRLDIDKPNRTDATESAKHIDPKLVKSTEAPAYCYLGEDLSVKITVSNAAVGHAFPGGTTDVNEAWIHFLVQDGQGKKIYESGFLDADNNVEQQAYFYKSVPIDRVGQEVWRHDLFNMVGDSFKRVIAPGGSDVTTYHFSVPDDAKGPLVISASVNYRKLNNRYARWALKNNAIQLPIVEMAAQALVLPIKIKPEIVGK